MPPQKKWWFRADIEKDFGEQINNEEGPYICRIEGDQTPYDFKVDTYFLKNRSDAYSFVCKYINDLFKKWDKEDIDNRDFKDWTHLYWRLNYGSGDGPTNYTLTIEPIIFEII